MRDQLDKAPRPDTQKHYTTIHILGDSNARKQTYHINSMYKGLSM